MIEYKEISIGKYNILPSILGYYCTIGFTTKWYRMNGRRHRADGPAVIHFDNNRQSEYWLNGIQYKDIPSDEYWIKYCKLLAFT